jgi:hypothetical protein
VFDGLVAFWLLIKAVLVIKIVWGSTPQQAKQPALTRREQLRHPACSSMPQSCLLAAGEVPAAALHVHVRAVTRDLHHSVMTHHLLSSVQERLLLTRALQLQGSLLRLLLWRKLQRMQRSPGPPWTSIHRSWCSRPARQNAPRRRPIPC